VNCLTNGNGSQERPPSSRRIGSRCDRTWLRESIFMEWNRRWALRGDHRGRIPGRQASEPSSSRGRVKQLLSNIERFHGAGSARLRHRRAGMRIVARFEGVTRFGTASTREHGCSARRHRKRARVGSKNLQRRRSNLVVSRRRPRQGWRQVAPSRMRTSRVQGRTPTTETRPGSAKDCRAGPFFFWPPGEVRLNDASQERAGASTPQRPFRGWRTESPERRRLTTMFRA